MVAEKPGHWADNTQIADLLGGIDVRVSHVGDIGRVKCYKRDKWDPDPTRNRSGKGAGGRRALRYRRVTRLRREERTFLRERLGEDWLSLAPAL